MLIQVFQQVLNLHLSSYQTLSRSFVILVNYFTDAAGQP